MSAGAEAWPSQPCPCGSEWRLHRRAATYCVFHCRGCYTKCVVGEGHREVRRLPYCKCGGLLRRHSHADGFAQVQCRTCQAKWEWKDGQLTPAQRWADVGSIKRGPNKLPYGTSKAEKAAASAEKQRLRLLEKRRRGLARVQANQAPVSAVDGTADHGGDQVPQNDNVVPLGS